MSPRGAFFVAMSDGLPLGCVGLKGTRGELAEVKRLWVAPAARGLGVGRRLMEAAENAARHLSVKTLRLDTNSALPEARQLYRSTGWTEIARFNDDPYPDLFFEKRL
jgi:GNAT superfamily N-acetyltransferase